MNTQTFTDYRKEAHTITSSAKTAKAGWAELKSWALGKGPIAMKAAVMECVRTYHNSPDIIVLMPELMQASIFSPYEKKAMLELASHKSGILENKLPIPQTAPSRLEPKLMFNLKAGSSVLHSEFGNDPRNAIFAIREQNRAILLNPKLPEKRAEYQKMDPKTIQSYSMAAGSRGEQLVRHLTDRLRLHESNEIANPIRPALKIQPKRKIKVKKKKARAR